MTKKKKKFYAVRVGRKTGIFETWDECKEQVHGFKGADYSSFKSREEAVAFLESEEAIKQPLAVKEELELTEKYSNEENTVVVYTDGSNTSVDTNEGKELKYSYGFLLVKDNDIIYEDYNMGMNKEAASLRNVAGELSAVMNAILHVKKNYPYKKIVVFHDYQGVSSWVTGEWKAKNNLVKKYVEFMSKAKTSLDIHFVKVTGHSGNKYNERVDFLARVALGLETME